MSDIIFGRPLAAWLSALILCLIVFFSTALLRRVSRRFDERGDGAFRSLLTGLGRNWLLFTSCALAIGAAAFPLALPERWLWPLRILLVSAVAIQVFVWARVVIEWGAQRYVATRSAHGDEADPALLGAVRTFRFVGQFLAALVVVLLALENLNVDVTALIAGLGIGGIAVALAAQNILGDLFGSLSITLDKPFVVGDSIVVGNESGTIEHIGLKTTRVRSVSGEQLVFSNSDLLTSRIRNFKRMRERRATFSFSVSRQTSPEELERIPVIVKQLVEEQTNVRFDRCHFVRIGDSSFDFDTVYQVGTPDMRAHLDRLQAIQIGLVRRLAEEGIELARPVRSVQLMGRESAVVIKGSES